MIRSTNLLLLALVTLLYAVGANAQEAQDDGSAAGAFARMDSDRDGQLSLKEFEQGLARPFGSQAEGVVYQKLPARFRSLDADGDSFLDASEYAGLASHWHGHGDMPTLAQADRNHDGRVDFREFAFIHSPSDDAVDDDSEGARAVEQSTPGDSSGAPRRAPGTRAKPAVGNRRTG